MKKLKRTMHSFVTGLLVSGLLQTSFAWDIKDTQAIGGAVTSVMGQYSQMQSQANQATMQAAAAAQAQQMMNTMKPQMGPAQFFPECNVLQRISNMPENACMAHSINPADVSKMLAFQTLAIMSSKEYEKSSLASIECISNQQKKFNSQLIDFQNRLKTMQDKLKQEAQVFRDNNAKLLSDMKKDWDDLHGTGSSIDAKTADPTQKFSPTCQSVLKGKKDAFKEGLVGLMNATSDDNKVATDFTINRPKIEQEILNEGAKVQAAIKANGMTGLNDPTVVSENYRDILGKVLGSETNSYKMKSDKLAADIQAIDPTFQTGDMDGVLSGNAENNIANSKANYKNKIMQKCMRGDSGFTNNEGLKINSQTIGGLITQQGTGGGTAADGYRQAVLNILNNDDVNVTLDMKIAQIKQLESEKHFNNIVFNTNINGRNTSMSASDAFAKLASDCESFFTQSSPDGGMSHAQKADRAQKALKDLKNLHDGLGDKIAQSISSSLIHCSGQGKKVGSTCNSLSMTPGSPSFTCLDSASECSQEIRGCYAEISSKVGQKTANIKSKGLIYNNNAKVMVERANALFSQQKAAVTSLLANLHQKFPGTNFVIGRGNGKDDPLFISDPAMEPSAFGIDLVAGGDMSKYLDELPGKIGNLALMFDEQQKKVEKEVKDYVDGPPPAGLKAALREQKGKWDKLASDCKSMIEGSMSDIAEANKKSQEMDQKKVDFCRKYNALATNPNPSCGKAQKLVGDMSNVVNSMSPQISDLAYQIDSTCDSSNNESMPASDVATTTVTDFNRFCGDSGDASDSELLANLRKNEKYKKNLKDDVDNLVNAAKRELTNKGLPTEEAAAASSGSGTAEAVAKKLSDADKALKAAKTKLADAEKALEDKRATTAVKYKDCTDDKKPDCSTQLTEQRAARDEKVDQSLKTAVDTAQTAYNVASEEERKGKTKPGEVDKKRNYTDSDISICERLTNIKNTTGKEKEDENGPSNKALANIIIKASSKDNNSKEANVDQQNLQKIVGEMQSTPCSGIASTTGAKDNFLDWLQKGPDSSGAKGVGK